MNLLLQLRWRDTDQRDTGVACVGSFGAAVEQMRIATCVSNDRTQCPSANHGIHNTVCMAEELPVASEGQIVGTTDMQHVAYIEGTREVVQLLVPQRVEPGSTVRLTAIN